MNDQVLIATDRWRQAHRGSRAAVVNYRNLAAAAESPAETPGFWEFMDDE